MTNDARVFSNNPKKKPGHFYQGTWTRGVITASFLVEGYYAKIWN